MQDVITFALAKGRLAEQAFGLLEGMGIDCSEPRNPGRQLVLWDRKNNVRFILVKPSDVPTYVDHGVADLGVVGKDTLLESGRPLYEVPDLTFGQCKLCVAGYAEASAPVTGLPSAWRRNIPVLPAASTTARGRPSKSSSYTALWSWAR